MSNKRMFESDMRLKDAKARITKASKDVAILRMMETRVIELQAETLF
jgi:hypothetical protein